MKAFLLLLFIAAIAQAELQPDLVINGTNVIVSNSTNYFSGGTTFLANQTSEVTFEFSFTCTNANKMKVGDGPTFVLDGGVDSRASTAIWQTNILSVVVPNVGSSNVAVLLTNPPGSLRYPFYRVGQIWNTNVSGTNFSGVKVRCFTKTGI